MDYPNGTCTADLVGNLTNSTGDGSSAESDDGALRMAIGIAMGIFGSVGINVGQNGQAISVVKDDGGKETRLPAWWWYTALYAAAAITNFVAFGFAPTTVLAPLEAFQFVSNFVWNYVTKNRRMFKQLPDGTYVHTKKFNRIRCGTLTVGLGILGPVFATPISNITINVKALKCMWTKLPWIIYLSTTGFVCAGLGSLYLITREQPTNKKSTNRGEQLLFAIPSATIGGFAVANAKIISILMEIHLVDGFTGFLDLFLSWFTWMVVVFVAGGFVVWVVLANRGPEIYDPLTAIPLLQGSYIVFSSTSGGIYFEDFLALSLPRHVLYWSGILVILGGLFQLVPPEDDEDRQALLDEQTVVKLVPQENKEDRQALFDKQEAVGLAVGIGAFFMPVLISVPQRARVKRSNNPDAPENPMLALKH